MRAARVALVVLALAVGLLAAPAVAGAAGGSDGSGGSDEVGLGSPAVGRLGECVERTGSLVAVLLVDVSRSLGTTDPDGVRVEGLQSVLKALTDLGGASGGDDDGDDDGGADVRVAVVGFAGELDDEVRWQPADEEHRDEIRDEIESYRQRDRTPYTDYGAALAGSIEALADEAEARAEADGVAPCRAVVWFTDGGFDPQGDASVDAEARRALCRAGGPVAQIAESGTFLFTLALTAEMSDQAREYLTTISDGSGDAEECEVEGSSTTGLYADAADAADLQFIFPPDGGEVEPGDGAFTVPAGVDAVNLNVATGGPGSTLVVRTPDGEEVRVEPGDDEPTTVGDLEVRPYPIGASSFEVDVALPALDGDWVGTWEVAFEGSTDREPRWRPTLRSGVRPDLVEPDELVLGEPAELVVELVDAAGAPVPESVRAAVDVEAALTDRASDQTDVVAVAPQGERFVASYTPPLELPSSELEVRVEARLDGADGRQPASRPELFLVPLRPPREFARVEPTRLDLPFLRGDDSWSEVELAVVGSTVSAGCVWIEGNDLALPGEDVGFEVAAEPAATSEADCLPVAEGGEGSLVVQVRPEEQVRGAAQGTVTVRVRSDETGEVLAQQLPATIELGKDPDQATLSLAVLIAALLAVVFPVGFLHLTNAWGARFAEPHLLRRVELDLEIDSVGGVRDAATGEVPTIDYLDSDPFGFGRGDRVTTVSAAGAEIATSASGRWGEGMSLLRGPSARAEAAGSVVLGRPSGSEDLLSLRSWRDHQVQELPLSLAGCWIFVPTEGLARADAPPLRLDDPLDELFGEGPDERAGADPEAPTAPVVYRGRFAAFISDTQGVAQADLMSTVLFGDVPLEGMKAQLDELRAPEQRRSTFDRAARRVRSWLPFASGGTGEEDAGSGPSPEPAADHEEAPRSTLDDLFGPSEDDT